MMVAFDSLNPMLSIRRYAELEDQAHAIRK